MFWILMAFFVVIGAMVVLRRRAQYESPREEAWRTSLEAENEPLDMEEIRQAEEEWLADDAWRDPSEDDSWH